MIKSCDFLIIGGGMVGLSIAHQLLERKVSNSIYLLEKEDRLGKHSSGRNSGVLHAGLYYKEGSLKSKVCVPGARRLKSWISKKGIDINNCGKVIIPQRLELDSQIDLLYQRGSANGANVHILDSKQLAELVPEAKSSSGRALWSPDTSVVNPLDVINKIENELRVRGINFFLDENHWEAFPDKRTIKLSNGPSIKYNHLINCAGLQADRVAHKFGVGLNYRLLPFKGLYFQVKLTSPLKIRTNLYPVPDLNIPFLGVHFTPGIKHNSPVTIGPTASIAFGRENYDSLEKIEPLMAISNISTLISQWIYDKGGFRKYVKEQAFLSLPPLFLSAAKQLIPSIREKDIETCEKVGIRAQLFNESTQELENDFLCLAGNNSTHVLNAVSPAFTASFELADLIIGEVLKNKTF